MTISDQYHQSGNVLWFILLGIALLGSLTMIVTRSGNKVEQSGSYEQYQIQYSKIMRYATGVEQGIQKLMSINGCSENDISFENDVATGVNTYENYASSRQDCLIFDPAGAGLKWQEFGDDNFGASTRNVVFNTDTAIENIGDDSNSLNSEILFMTHVSQGMCDFVNSKLGIDTSGLNVTFESHDPSDNRFQGSHTNNHKVEASGDAPGLSGKSTGCMIIEDGASQFITFYHVVLAR